jgi:hypothetical protein
MSHVLDPEYYDRACGELGRKTVVAVMDEIARMGNGYPRSALTP